MLRDTAEKSMPKLGERGKHVTIRLAKSPSDVQAIIDLGMEAHSESLYKEMSVDREKLEKLGDLALSRSDSHSLLMAERKGELIGFLVAMANEHFFSRELAATCLILFVSSNHRGSLAAVKLLYAFRKWTKARGIKHLYIHVTSGVATKQTDKFLRRLGFQQSGGNYSMNLEVSPAGEMDR